MKPLKRRKYPRLYGRWRTLNNITTMLKAERKELMSLHIPGEEIEVVIRDIEIIMDRIEQRMV